MKAKNTNLTETAKILELPRSTLQGILAGKVVSYRTLSKVERFFKKRSFEEAAVPEAGAVEPYPEPKTVEVSPEESVIERVEQLKHTLLALELELRFFRKSGEEARKVLRERLDSDDIGYITSSLSMVFGDEERFKRSLGFSTYKFRFFQGKG